MQVEKFQDNFGEIIGELGLGEIIGKLGLIQTTSVFFDPAMFTQMGASESASESDLLTESMKADNQSEEMIEDAISGIEKAEKVLGKLKEDLISERSKRIQTVEAISDTVE
jgi:hypothetical protein